MGTRDRMLALAAVIVAALLVAPNLYARDNHDSSGSMMGRGMMGDGSMMGRMSRMMQHCGGMMRGGPRNSRPNDQWRSEPPPNPDKKD